ncbi:MAG TPA: DUF3995 domain-containing protein [Kineosporiaceae bacterium]|nr:DUF3995 domain-containing protein [Kineosporiaceae bacterium]
MGQRALRGTALVVASGLAAIGVLHAVWSVTPWPLADRESFARVVVGVPVEQSPSPGLALMVAGLLVAAGYLVASGGLPALRIGPRWVLVAGRYVVAGVLLLRGAGGVVLDLAGSPAAPADFVRFDLMLYSPLCLALGTGASVVARRGRRLAP